MQAIVFAAPETLSCERVADPTCASEEVIVRVARAGICGTDLHIFRNEYMSDFPVIAGHEFCGSLVEVGSQVQDRRTGERVTVDPNLYCGQCYYCRREQANQCLNWQGVGITRPGAFAEYVEVPAAACYRVPDELNDLQATMVEPVACVVHALDRLRLTPGDEVLIFGAGPMGLLLIQALRHFGAGPIVVVEPQAERLALAKRLGATRAITPAELRDLDRDVAPFGFAVVVDATGAPPVIEVALQHLKPRGTYLQFGVAPKDATIRVRPYDIFKNDWTLIGSFALCYNFEQALAWLASGVFDVTPLVSDTVALTDFEQAFRNFAAGQTLKVHVTPGK